MNNKEVDASRLNKEGELRNSGFATIEASAVKRVVREGWESKLKEKGTTLDILNDHVAFMTREFDAIDYETLCMQLIASRARHMSRGELLTYTKTIEALAVGYKERFGSDFGSLLIAGVTLVARDVKAVRGHLDYFLSHLSKNAAGYERRIWKEVRKVERMDSDLRAKNSGIFSFFRRKEIALLDRRIRAGRLRLGRLEKKKLRYAKLAEETRVKADRHAAKKPGTP